MSWSATVPTRHRQPRSARGCGGRLDTGAAGRAGAIWCGGISKEGVAVPHGDGDVWFTWGAVQRIASGELRGVADVALEMMAISEEAARD